MDHIEILSDEINRLIYSYFKDSGFEHSAFVLAKESGIECSPYFSAHIRRGELVELLAKSLLYIEAEYHYEVGAPANKCQSRFTLLGSHVCSEVPPEPLPVVTDHSCSPKNLQNGTTQPEVEANSVERLASKRKARQESWSDEDSQQEKRPRWERGESQPDVDEIQTEFEDAVHSSNPDSSHIDSSVQKSEGARIDHPSLLFLPRHESEVEIWHR
ncbi:hypothetical protein VKT23_017407 [Stygiomarasmius scandens]|uniref:LisH domain-containing protein n=1 Tax=Marasmiellus scandens TaxID=2682957 RepID=A0ABR1IS62_9AGAR